MKFYLVLLAFAMASSVAFAQSDAERKIRELDQLEAQATINGDTSALKKLWSPNFVVNNPANTVVDVQQIRQLMKEGKISYTSFKRVIERVTITGDVAVTMGYEENQPDKATDNSGKIVTRRYTNVWLKQKSGWHIIARQATITGVR